jgi:Spy/CpxP family protein refolding chaperone
MTRPLLVATVLLAAVSPAVAQQHQHGQSPYAGFEGREIKALSPEELQQLRDGEGMGTALPAELNHYPGPKHVQALAEALGLSVTQREQVRAIEESMRARAVALGAEIIEKERLLDRAFAGGGITDDALRELTGAIARLQGDLRYAHLSAHLGVKRALTEEQIAKYDELRGYRQAPAPR